MLAKKCGTECEGGPNGLLRDDFFYSVFPGFASLTQATMDECLVMKDTPCRLHGVHRRLRIGTMT